MLLSFSLPIAFAFVNSPSTSATVSASSSAIEPAADFFLISTRRVSTIVEATTGVDMISGWLSTMNRDNTSVAFGQWPDVNYATGCAAQRANWPADVHWDRLLTMSGAWKGAAGAERYTQDPDLYAAISIGMDWWFSRDFINPACLDSGGTSACPCDDQETRMWNTNWFSNIIGIPERVSATCVLMNDTLSQSQLNNCTHMTARSYGTFDRVINGLGVLSGANTLDVAKIGVDLAILTVNATLITDAYRRVHNELQIRNAAAADGIRADGSFGQHGGMLYNGNYGKDYSNDLLDLEHESSQTQFAANQTSQTAFSTFFDGSRWMIYYNTVTQVLHWDFSVLGRFISFPVADNQATASININLTKVEQLGQEWEAPVLVEFAQSLSEPSRSANAGGLTGNRMFFTNDYMVHRGENYVSTVKMYSSRTRNTECTNLQNPFGFHLADGANYIYLRGDEYEDIAAAQDWNLIPGITVDYGATQLDCAHTGYSGIERFVGGVSDGRAGIAAMRYTNPISGSLRFQKAWFFLQDDLEYVMISGINSTTSSPVFSVLDQKRRRGPITINGLLMNSSQNVTGVESVWHDQVGYSFDPSDDINLSIQVGERSGDWSKLGISMQPPATIDLFAAWIIHSELDRPVAYSLFPGTDAASFEIKRHSHRVRQIKNDASISALLDPARSTVMAIFWDTQGGVIQLPALTTVQGAHSLAASGNIAVIYDMRTGQITVADPSQQLQTVVITLVFRDGTRSSTFALPSGGTGGDSVSRNVEEFHQP